MPYYAFILADPDKTHQEMNGEILKDDHAARLHASRIIRHLKTKRRYDNPELAIIAKDAGGTVVFTMSFGSTPD
jgi:hypothetical protein